MYIFMRMIIKNDFEINEKKEKKILTNIRNEVSNQLITLIMIEL